MKIRRKDKENFVLFCVVLFFIGMALISIFWNADNYYSKAYRPLVDDANARHRLEKKLEQRQEQNKTVEPRAPGFRESDIEKHRGHRYATF